jgi:hypothetical protein
MESPRQYRCFSPPYDALSRVTAPGHVLAAPMTSKHPASTFDRSLAVKPASILELKGKTQIDAVPGVTIDWDEVLVKTS